MPDLLESVRDRCADIEPGLVSRHFRQLPPSYFERYSAADIGRHVRLLARLGPERKVDVEVRPLAPHAFEILTVGYDHSGVVACITAALAALGFNLEDVQVSTYLAGSAELAGLGEPPLFVIVLRVSGSLRGRAPADLAENLRERLALAFVYLEQGKLLDAQAVSANTDAQRPDVDQLTPVANEVSRERGHEGTVVGSDFRLQQRLAVGGMSEVYLATQLSLNRTVVVKLIRHELPPEDDQLARFYEEGLVLGQFACPYIVQVFAAGTTPGRAGGVLGWMAMEYMAGGDLARWHRQHGPPPVELAARWLRETLEGLHYAHRHGVLHRDLKPHNLLLSGEGHVKVSDFGLFKHAPRGPGGGHTPERAIVGTPHYMSPEQALGESVDERSDIFSLGTTFFFLLSGRLPFDRSSPAATLIQLTQEDAPRLAAAAPHLPTPLSVIVGRMMARRCEERYQDVGVVLEDLTSYERRGLLKVSESGAFFPVRLGEAVPAEDETQPYRAPIMSADG